MSHLRFIPAWAGNRLAYLSIAAAIPVHPRVGGEQGRVTIGEVVITGSSPRGRGTGGADPAAAGKIRFIPAWAGNSLSSIDYRAPWAVHPRVGGEQ